MEYREPAIRMVMMPKDTNHLGSIFGGHILSLIDQAAGYEARRNSPKKFVTKVMREVEFIAPVYIGDSVSFYTETKRVGKTSVQVSVEVVALRGEDCLTEQKVTSADVVMVAVDGNGNPISINT